MTNFICQICFRSFKRKDYLEKHNNRKFPCKPIENGELYKSGKSKVSICGKSKVSINSKKSDFGQSKVSIGKYKVSIGKSSVSIENETEKNDCKKQEKKYKCDYCEKEYRHKQSKYTHLKKCKKYKIFLKKQENYNKILENL